MKKTGFWLYFWALAHNVGIVAVIVSYAGIAAFEIGWVARMCSALAVYLIVVIALIRKGRVLHPVLVYGLPLIVILLCVYELMNGPSLHLVTLTFLVIGRVMDMRGRRDTQPNQSVV
jgi:hypothetical protein